MPEIVENGEFILLMEEILYQLIWRVYHSLQGFIHILGGERWISAINSRISIFQVASRHATSKIRQYADLSSLTLLR